MKPISRRSLLSHLMKVGVTSATLPYYIPILNAATSPRQKKKRLIVYFTAHGQVASEWYPNQDIELRDYGYGARGCRLDGLNNPLSNIFDQSFKKYYPKMNLIRGLDIIPAVNVKDHWGPKILGCQPFGGDRGYTETMDQVIARSQTMRELNLPLNVLNLQIKGRPDGGGILSAYRSANGFVGVNPIYDPKQGTDFAFGGTPQDPIVTDILRKQLDQLLGQGSLSPKDKDLLMIHREFLEQHRVTSPSKLKVVKDLGLSEQSDSDDVITRNFIKLISNAIKYDRTRNIVLAMNEFLDEKIYSFLPGLGGRYGFHSTTHLLGIDERWEAYKEIQRWHAFMLRTLLDELDQVEDQETGETYLDNSLVLWISETSVKTVRGDFHSTHVSEDLPVAMFGGCGGEIKTGYYLDFRKPGQKKKYPNVQSSSWPPNCLPNDHHCVFGEQFPDIGRPYNELLISIMKAIGVQPEEWERFNPNNEIGFGSYEQNFENQYELGDRRSSLPIIT